MRRIIILAGIAALGIAVQACGEATINTKPDSTTTTAYVTKPKAAATPADDTDGDGVPDSKDGAPFDANRTEAQPEPASTPTPTATPAGPEVADVGDAIQVSDSDGNYFTVKLVRIIDPVATGEWEEPESGFRYVGARMRITNGGSDVYDDSPSNGMQMIYGSDDEQADSEITVDSNCKEPGSVKLRPGASRTFCVSFQIPKGDDVTGLQFTPDSGFADDTAEWEVSQ